MDTVQLYEKREVTCIIFFVLIPFKIIGFIDDNLLSFDY